MENNKPKMEWYRIVLLTLSCICATISVVFIALYYADAYQHAQHFMFFAMTLGWLFNSCAYFRKDSTWSKFQLIFFSIMTVLYVFLIVDALTK